MAAQVTDESMDQLPLLAGFRVVPYYALTRFGQWDEMLAEPAPADRFVYLKGTWHYARGIAFAGKGQLDDAEIELAQVKKIAGGTALDFTLFSPNKAAAIFAIAPEVLAGDIALKQKDVRRGDRPPRSARCASTTASSTPSRPSGTIRRGRPWPRPLLEAGRPHEAETIYWDDLRRNPENGWSLFGLAQALARPGPEGRGHRRRGALPEGLGQGRREAPGLGLLRSEGVRSGIVNSQFQT